MTFGYCRTCDSVTEDLLREHDGVMGCIRRVYCDKCKSVKAESHPPMPEDIHRSTKVQESIHERYERRRASVYAGFGK